MALDILSAETEANRFGNPGSPLYVGDPEDLPAIKIMMSDGHSNLLFEATKLVHPPSIGVVAARDALKAVLLGATYDAAYAAFYQASLAAFTITVAAGMVGQTTTSPPGTVVSASKPAALFIPVGPAPDHSSMCLALATQIVAWLATGTATVQPTVGGPTVDINWT